MGHFRTNENRLIDQMDGTSPGRFAGKRGSVKRAIEGANIERYFANLETLGPKDIEEIIKEVGFFEEHPDIADDKIADFFRRKAEWRTSIAEIVSEKGREGLREILNKISKGTVH